MYSSCLRCNRSLGTNSEIPHLRIGRKIAFDTTRGRLWVICPHCGQWNLTPLEERWEALVECDRLASSAEARAGGKHAALAQTTTGLELLRVGGMSNADIANWRYGRRIQSRQERHLWALMPLMSLAIPLGVGAWRVSGAAVVGAYSAGLAAVFLFLLWRRPPRLWTSFTDGDGRRRIVWPWQLLHVRIEHPAQGRPALVVPRMRGDLRLRGPQAAATLASLLPKLNGADCAMVTLPRVLARVADAEKEARRPPRMPGRAERRRLRARGQQPSAPPAPRRAWEHLVRDASIHRVIYTLPEYRLALEMAVTEEVEQLALESRTETLTEEWRDEEEIGAISDDLLLPESVSERLRDLQEREAGGETKDG